MGGKSPNIICADADIDAAAKWTATGIFFNHGQCCCAGSRVFVHESIYDEFMEKLIAHAAAIKVGPQFDDESEHGPLVDDIQFKRVMRYIKLGREQGAKVLISNSFCFANIYT